MKDDLQETKNYLQEISERLYIYITQISPSGLDWIVHIIVKLALLCAVFLIVDFVFKFVINAIFRSFHNEEKFPVLKSIYQSKITNSVAHFAALTVVGEFKNQFFLKEHYPRQQFSFSGL